MAVQGPLEGRPRSKAVHNKQELSTPRAVPTLRVLKQMS